MVSVRQRKERISRSRDWSAKRSTQLKRTRNEKSKTGQLGSQRAPSRGKERLEGPTQDENNRKKVRELG